MADIQALNAKTSPSQRAYRVSLWAGSENDPGIQIAWVVYGSGVPSVVARAIRVFRRQTAKKRRFQDWTINVGPLLASETIVPYLALAPVPEVPAGGEGR